MTAKPTMFLGGQGLCSTTADYERFCRMILNRGELNGVRVLKPETADLMFQNHLKPELGQKYGLGGAVDGAGGYSWGGANGTQFWIDRKNNLFALFMVQTQHYRAPTYGTFRNLVNKAAGIGASRSGTWFLLEYLILGNTKQPDGTVRIYVDGKQVVEHTNAINYDRNIPRGTCDWEFAPINGFRLPLGSGGSTTARSGSPPAKRAGRRPRRRFQTLPRPAGT